MDFLQGKRTYILVAVALLVWLGSIFGFINQDATTKILELLGFGALGTIRLALKK